VVGSLIWRVARKGPAAQFIGLGVAAARGITLAFLVVFLWSVFAQRLEARTIISAQFLTRALTFLGNRDGFCLALWVVILVGQSTLLLWAFAFEAHACWVGWL